jgi:hypothetical protein
LCPRRLGGSEGAYSVAQDGSTPTLQITSSSVDLEAHVGQQVELTGQKSSAAVFVARDGPKQTLPNTAAPSLKAVKITGNLGADGKRFVSDKDSKSWTVTNPDSVKGHHVTLTAHVDAVKSEVEIISLKMAK